MIKIKEQINVEMIQYIFTVFISDGHHRSNYFTIKLDEVVIGMTRAK